MSKETKREEKIVLCENDAIDETTDDTITDTYTNQIIDDIIGDKIDQVCLEMSSYVKNYQYETALPFAEYLDWGNIHDFILCMGRE